MSGAESEEVDALFKRVRDLAEPLAARHRGLPHYAYILACVEGAEQSSDAQTQFMTLRPLGVFAAREFDNAAGEYGLLADAIFALVWAAQRRAGAPD